MQSVLVSRLLNSLVVVSLLLPSLSFGACPDSMATLGNQTTPSTPSRSDYWRSEFIKAHQVDDRDAELYAFLKFVVTDSKFKQFNKSVLGAAKRTLRTLELASLERDYARFGKTPKLLARMLAFLGVSEIFQNQVYGLRPFSHFEQKAQSLKTLSLDAALTVGPIIISVLRGAGLKNIWLSTATLNLPFLIPAVLSRDPKLVHELEIFPGSTANFSEVRDALSTHFSSALRTVNFTPRRSYIWGRVLLPWLFASTIFVSQGVYPYRYLQDESQRILPYSEKFYLGDEFLNDITRQIGEVKKKNILIAYSNSLFPSVDYRQSPPMALIPIHNFAVGNTVSTIGIDSISDLKSVDLGHYDDVMILAHGLPDYDTVGLSSAGLVRLKKGANLVFYSCLVAQRGGRIPEDENWIRFSKQILNGGKAFASTKIIWSGIISDAGGKAVDENKEKNQALLETLEHGLLDIMGVEQIYDGFNNLVWLSTNQYYLAPKGVRVYDSQTNKVTFIPSLPPQAQ